MKRLAPAMFLLCLVSACFAEDRATPESRTGHSTQAARQEASTMKIRMTINGKSMTATLTDSPTTRDFIALLPLTLKLDDYEATEKIAYLPKSSLPKAHRQALIPTSATSLTTPPGAIWRSSTGISDIPRGSSSWGELIPVSKHLKHKAH